MSRYSFECNPIQYVVIEWIYIITYIYIHIYSAFSTSKRSNNSNIAIARWRFLSVRGTGIILGTSACVWRCSLAFYSIFIGLSTIVFAYFWWTTCWNRFSQVHAFLFVFRKRLPLPVETPDLSFTIIKAKKDLQQCDNFSRKPP